MGTQPRGAEPVLVPAVVLGTVVRSNTTDEHQMRAHLEQRVEHQTHELGEDCEEMTREMNVARQLFAEVSEQFSHAESTAHRDRQLGDEIGIRPKLLRAEEETQHHVRMLCVKQKLRNF